MRFSPTDNNKLPAAAFLLAGWAATAAAGKGGVGRRNLVGPHYYARAAAAAAAECTIDADCIKFFRGCRLEYDPDDPPVCSCDARAGSVGDSYSECDGASESNACLCAGCVPDANFECLGYDAVCRQGKCTLDDASAASSGSSSAGGCGSDGECELFSDYCGGCNCRAKPTGGAVPPCPADRPTVNCFVDPCDSSIFDFVPYCVADAEESVSLCVSVSPSRSVCPTPREPCMNDGNWRRCKDLEDGGCQDIAMLESCPLQFACNDGEAPPPDGPIPFRTDDPNSCTGNKLTVANVAELGLGQAICAQTVGTSESNNNKADGSEMWYQFGLLGDGFAPGTLHLLHVDYGPTPPLVKVVWSALDDAGSFAVGEKVKLTTDGNLALLDGGGGMAWDAGCGGGGGSNPGKKLVLKHNAKLRPGRDNAVMKLKAKSKPKVKWIVKQSGKEKNKCAVSP